MTNLPIQDKNETQFSEDFVDNHENQNLSLKEKYWSELKEKVTNFLDEIFSVKLTVRFNFNNVIETYVEYENFYLDLKKFLKETENIELSQKNIIIDHVLKSEEELKEENKEICRYSDKLRLEVKIYIPYKNVSSTENLKIFLEERKKKINELFLPKKIPFFEIQTKDVSKNFLSLRNKKFRFSEIFGETFQGEGFYTGVNTVWYRSWGCNFNCAGFGQENSDPETWKFDWDLNPNITNVDSIEKVPILKRGCDSSYSWSKKFFHLSKNETPEQIVNRIESFLKNPFNPNGKFIHPNSGQSIHLAFTGGEPLLSQSAIVAILLELLYRNNLPSNVTIETNGTQKLNEKFCWIVENLKNYNKYFYQRDFELFWSVSPKLSLSGEKWEDAIKPETVGEYALLSDKGQLKFVVDGSEKIWDELKKALSLYRLNKNKNILWDVWVMPVGSEREDLEKHQAKIAEEALKRGYYFSARVHCWVFGNVTGK